MKPSEENSTLPTGSWPWFNDVMRRLGGLFARVIYRIHTHHLDRVPQTGGLVVVANHMAFLDGPVLFGLLGRRSVFLVKHEQFHGVLGWFLRRLGQLPLRRGTPDRTSLLAAVQLLQAGGVIGIFPEGTRGTGEVAKAQQGAAWLARSGRAMVLPVACRGLLLEGGTRHRFRPQVDVLVGEPFSVPLDKGRAALADATELIRATLADLVTELDRLRSGAPGNAQQEKGDNS